ncbi:hypothetical protein SELMODRAFT_427937 [Selaginella moellendorffii]|uniref:Uncharacterized protein n=1 Tax=Selaginella moellendorffii TaxID=88036 RepID=D8T164_SELML|nr:hypothetical protein SELMODRAFT_427937 [Selaginella moellendorffii]
MLHISSVVAEHSWISERGLDTSQNLHRHESFDAGKQDANNGKDVNNSRTLTMEPPGPALIRALSLRVGFGKDAFENSQAELTIRKEKEVYGNNLEMQAMVEMYNRPIHV